MNDLRHALDYLKMLPKTYYGKIILHIRKGKIVHLTDEKSVKIDNTDDNE